MKTILLAASAALLASTAPALAQDAAAPTAAPSDAAATFTGPRAEIFGGWDHTRRKDGFAGQRDHATSNGVTGGVLLGYDLPIGDTFVVGPFASYAITSSKECSDAGCVKSNRQLEGGARAGVKLMNGKALAYVKGAYVNGQFNAHLLNNIDTPQEDYVVAHRNRDGWRAGGGLQYALTRHAYVKAEYDYTKFDSFKSGEFADLNATDIRFSRQEVLGGFGVQF